MCRDRHEEDIAGPIRCRLLGHAEYEITEDVITALTSVIDPAALLELADYVGVRFRDEYRLRATLATLPESVELLANIYPILAASLTADSAKSSLVKDARAFEIVEGDPPTRIPPELISAGNLSTWGTGLNIPVGKRLLVDPVRGRYFYPSGITDGAALIHYHYGFSGEVGAGTYDRRGSVLTTVDGTFSGGGTVIAPPWASAYTFADSKSYIVPDVTPFTALTLQAASQQRPYLRRATGEGTDWVFTPGGLNAELTLDGLWFGGSNVHLNGDFKRVTIRHCTLDPGGTRANTNVLLPAEIVVEGTVNELIVERSIIAGIRLMPDSAVLSLVVRDSIVHAVDEDVKIDLPDAALLFERSTIAVETIGLRIDASEILAQKKITVLDHQNGCVRFSVLAPLSHTPPVYRGQIADIPSSYFVSQRFGDPGYHALSETAPDFITRGAENGSELGAFATLLNPLKLDSLRAKIHEFMPFGRVAAFIRET